MIRRCVQSRRLTSVSRCLVGASVMRGGFFPTKRFGSSASCKLLLLLLPRGRFGRCSSYLTYLSCEVVPVIGLLSLIRVLRCPCPSFVGPPGSAAETYLVCSLAAAAETRQLLRSGPAEGRYSMGRLLLTKRSWGPSGSTT